MSFAFKHSLNSERVSGHVSPDDVDAREQELARTAKQLEDRIERKRLKKLAKALSEPLASPRSPDANHGERQLDSESIFYTSAKQHELQLQIAAIEAKLQRKQHISAQTSASLMTQQHPASTRHFAYAYNRQIFFFVQVWRCLRARLGCLRFWNTKKRSSEPSLPTSAGNERTRHSPRVPLTVRQTGFATRVIIQLYII